MCIFLCDHSGDRSIVIQRNTYVKQKTTKRSNWYSHKKVKAYESVLAEIEVAQRDFEKLVMELTSQVSESNSFGARFNIFSWLKIRADMKTKIAKVRSESSRLTQLAEQGTFLCSSFSIGYPTADQPKINKGFDAVIGRGTTIVYVGQKCVG